MVGQGLKSQEFPRGQLSIGALLRVWRPTAGRQQFWWGRGAARVMDVSSGEGGDEMDIYYGRVKGKYSVN